MSIENRKDVRFIVVVVGFIIGIVLYNMIMDFKIYDIPYLGLCIYFLITFLYSRNR